MDINYERTVPCFTARLPFYGKRDFSKTILITLYADNITLIKISIAAGNELLNFKLPRFCIKFMQRLLYDTGF